MSVATVTSKGQVTIPQDVRERLGIVTGSKIEFFERPDGTVEFIPRTRSISDLAGVFAGRGLAVTVEQMDDAIAAAIADDDLRSRE
jgi:antitoxin PrlF